MDLPYGDDSFDAVIIANALHIVPDPEKVLAEIDRVLRPGGLLIAPNFVEHKGTALSRIWSGILQIAGVRFEHQWTAAEYLAYKYVLVLSLGAGIHKCVVVLKDILVALSGVCIYQNAW